MRDSHEMSGLSSLSGGLFYHYLGLRYANNLWRPTRNSISEALQFFITQHKKKILLIGPSGGYLLNNTALLAADHIECVDIDPLASSLFRLKHLKKTNWKTKDVFSFQGDTLDIRATQTFLKSYQSCAVVFCNILGQLPFMYPKTWTDEESLSNWKSDFLNLMKEYNVFSFHDRLTFVGPKPALDIATTTAPLNNQDLLSHIDYSKSSDIIDHETFNILKGSYFSYLMWSMTPKEHHVLEVLYNS